MTAMSGSLSKVVNSPMRSLGRTVGQWHSPACGRGSSGRTIRCWTVTIITTSAHRMMAELHDRMPVILEPQDWSAWLGEVEVDAATLLRPADGDVLNVWPVSRQVNSPKSDEPELLEAIGQG